METIVLAPIEVKILLCRGDHKRILHYMSILNFEFSELRLQRIAGISFLKNYCKKRNGVVLITKIH
jgi:hypothetical protein